MNLGVHLSYLFSGDFDFTSRVQIGSSAWGQTEKARSNGHALSLRRYVHRLPGSGSGYAVHERVQYTTERMSIRLPCRLHGASTLLAHLSRPHSHSISRAPVQLSLRTHTGSRVQLGLKLGEEVGYINLRQHRADERSSSPDVVSAITTGVAPLVMLREAPWASNACKAPPMLREAPWASNACKAPSSEVVCGEAIVISSSAGALGSS